MSQQQNSKPIVSFIVPTLNEGAMLPGLLASIDNQQSTLAYEVIVVDANSRDDTVAIARSHNCTIISTEPGPVSNSRNLGAAAANGEILAFVDADCELPKNWLSAICTELQREEVVATGAAMSEQSATGSAIARAWFELAHSQRSAGDRQQAQWLATFNLAVKAGAFNKVNGYNTSLVTCEDVEFSYRLRELGELSQLYNCPVIHRGESHSIREFYRREAWRARGTLAILRQHWKNPRELASSLLPFAVSLCLLVSALGLVALLNGYPSGGIIASLAPALLLLLGFIKGARKSLLLSALILGLYYVARTQGSLMPFRRVAR